MAESKVTHRVLSWDDDDMPESIYSLSNPPAFITRSTSPVEYRLIKKKTGELVLQGAFRWQEGWNKSGINWEDLPTEVE